MCCTVYVTVTHLSSSKARIDVTIAGVSFVRIKTDATRRNAPRRIDLDWDDITGAGIHTTSSGRAVIRVDIAGVPTPLDHRHDPHAFKVPRGENAAAEELVEQINYEVAVRRRWRESASAAEA